MIILIMLQRELNALLAEHLVTVETRERADTCGIGPLSRS